MTIASGQNSSVPPDERDAILAIVNAAAEAYRGVIPADRWHEPYMPATSSTRRSRPGSGSGATRPTESWSASWGSRTWATSTLIRHAYVAPGSQRRGVGGALLEQLVAATERPILVGTWAAADWAIRFYERHGFELVPPERTAELLRTYWSIPDRQIETSVVLTRRALTTRRANASSPMSSSGTFQPIRAITRSWLGITSAAWPKAPDA